MTTYTARPDWPAIHAAGRLVAAARIGTRIGYEACADAFGGSYHATTFESHGLAGLVMLASSAQTIARHAWETVHGGSRAIEAAATVRESDAGPWVCVMPDGEQRIARSRRGARWMASHHGGTAQRVPGTGDAAKRRQNAVATVRAAVEVAIHLHQLMTLLAEAGVIEYHPASQICGIHDGRINLHGIRWIRGETESGTPPTIDEARAAVDTQEVRS